MGKVPKLKKEKAEMVKPVSAKSVKVVPASAAEYEDPEAAKMKLKGG
jgi:hypothetical protein